MEDFGMLIYQFKKPPMFNIPKTINSYQFLLNLDSDFALTLLIRDLEISYITVSSEKDRQYNKQIPLTECNIFITIIKTTINYLIEKRNKVKTNIDSEEGIKDELYRLIKSLVPLYYKVEGNRVYIRTPNQELVDRIVNNLKDKKVVVVYDKA